LEIAERKRAEETLKQSQDELRKMAAHQDYMKEEERRQIAREIHDELGGALTGIRSYLSFIVEEARRSATRPDRHVLEARNLADSAIETARRVGSELRPSVLDQLGLWAALEWHAEQIEASTGLTCSVSIDAQTSRLSLDPERSTALFRIVQEALANVVRHAKASCVTIRATCENDSVVIELHDDGAGTRSHGLLTSKSRSIAGMVERARHLGGDLDINRGIEEGTVVVLRMPIGETNER
jgi:signal transduction histidine kinase